MTVSSADMTEDEVVDVPDDKPLLGRGYQGSVSKAHLCANIITGGLGTGILSMPWCTAGASLFTSAAIAGLVLLLNAVTIMILVRAAEEKQKFDLGALLSCLPGNVGRVARVVTDVCVWISMWLCLVGYMIVVADTGTDVAPDADPLKSRPFWVSVGTACVFPLCFLDVKYLAFSSTLSIIVNLYLFIQLCLKAAQFARHDELPGDFCAVGFTKGNIAYLSNMMFTTVVQVCILPMYRELKDRTPRRFASVLGISFTTLWVLFTAFAGVGYLAYGKDVESNVLKNFPRNVVGHVGRVGMFVVILGVYPIMLMPMVAPIRTAEEHHIEKETGEPAPPRRFRLWSALATALICGTVMVCAFFVKNLATVNIMNGALCATAFVALGPGLVAWYMFQPGPIAKASIVGLFVMCVIFSSFGFVFQDNYSEELIRHCKWSWN